MATKSDLGTWIVDALEADSRSAEPVDVARFIWQHHEGELRASGDLFFTWQYDMRWEAQKLRNQLTFRTSAG
ncbi:MAG: hypothetical protein JJE50_04555 [Actinomycetales bacterium]|nr:hypothetical protein [Actinomycetales bacterium]